MKIELTSSEIIAICQALNLRKLELEKKLNNQKDWGWFAEFLERDFKETLSAFESICNQVDEPYQKAKEAINQ